MRNYAQVSTTIWQPGSEFRSLSADAQRVYLLLISQPDISAVGLLPLTVRRWASLAANTTATDLSAPLSELESARYVVIDRDTEELLVRSFVKWDNGYGNPKRRPVIVRAAQAVASMTIRWAIAEEFRRLGLPTEGLPDTDPDSLSARLPDDVPPSNGVVVTEVEEELPQPSTHNPQPVPPGNSVAAPDTSQGLIGEWLSHCRARPPKNVIGQVGKHVAAMLSEGIDPTDVRRGLAAWHQKGLHPSTLPSVVNEVMNGPGTRGPGNVVALRRPSTPEPGAPGTPEHFQRAMARALAKEEGMA